MHPEFGGADNQQRLHTEVGEGIPRWRDNLNRSHAPELLSVHERWRRVNKHILGLYDWYREKSQTTRIWQPIGGGIVLDKSHMTYKHERVIWAQVRQLQNENNPDGLHPHMGVIFQGLSDVEFYAADYANQVIEMLQTLPGGTGTNYARALFNNAWASEESNHARFWALVTQAIGLRTADEVQERADIMHARGKFVVPPQSTFHMLAYVVAQELATQVTYKKVGQILTGKLKKPNGEAILPGNEDPELARGTAFINRDEVAHFKFFKEVLEVVMYYFPTETMDAILYVTDPENFRMPSSGSIPQKDYTRFERVAAAQQVLTKPILANEVFAVVLKIMRVDERDKWVEAMRYARKVPGENGEMKDTAQFEGDDIHLQYNFALLAEDINRKVSEIHAMYEAAGLDPDKQATQFVETVIEDKKP